MNNLLHAALLWDHVEGTDHSSKVGFELRVHDACGFMYHGLYNKCMDHVKKKTDNMFFQHDPFIAIAGLLTIYTCILTLSFSPTLISNITIIIYNIL